MYRIPVAIAVPVLVAFQMQAARSEDLSTALSPEELRTVSKAVDRGLEWLARHQNADGSYDGLTISERAGPSPGETSYALLAFLSRGHQPGRGRYGASMSRAIDWLLSTQRPDGSFSTRPPEEWPLSQSHSLSCLALSEVYGVTPAEQGQRVGQAIERALAFGRTVQAYPKKLSIFRGGWGYGGETPGLARLNHTSQSLVFLRSANNAGFKVDQAWVDEGLEYVARCYAPGPHIDNFRRLPVNGDQGVFRTRPQLPAGVIKEDLGIPRGGRHPYSWTNFNTTAAGVLALALNGRREDPMVRNAGDWLAEHSFPRQGTNYDFYYACYISCEAMSQIGGKHWTEFYPRVVRTLLPHQDRDGRFRQDRPLYQRKSPVYCTGLAVLCLTLPDQLLPIHQR